MALPIFDKLDDVPEAFRSEYLEKDGKWHPKPSSDELGEKGKKALQDEREAKKKEKDRADTAERERDELKRTAEATEKGISKEALDKIRADEAAKIKPVQDELDRVKAENRKIKLNDRVQALALAAGVMPDRIAKAMRDLESRVDLTEDGDAIVVKDAKGNVTSETVEDFLGKTYRAESPFFYSGKNGSGSGAEGGGGGGDTGGYDPIAAGKAAAKEQTKGREQNALAFK